MFKKNNTDGEIGTALARVDEVLDERQKVAAAIAKTAADIKVTEAELQRALEHLGAEEADLALVEDTATHQRQEQAQRDVQDLRLRLEAQQARLRGLDRKVIENEDRIRSANDGLVVAREVWARTRVAEFRAEYLRAVSGFAGVLRKGAALGDALGVNDLSAAMRQAKLYDPADLSCSIIDMEPMRTNEVAGLMEHYRVWEDDLAAKSVHDALVHVRLAAEQIQRIDDQIRQRREEAARAEQRRRTATEARPATVAYEVYYPPEYSPVPRLEFVEAGKK